MSFRTGGTARVLTDPATDSGGDADSMLDPQAGDLLTKALMLWTSEAGQRGGRPVDALAYRLHRDLRHHCILFKIADGRKLQVMEVGRSVEAEFGSFARVDGGGSDRNQEVVEAFQVNLQHVQANGRPLDFEFKARSRNDCRKSYRCMLLPYFDSDGSPKYLLGAIGEVEAVALSGKTDAGELVLDMNMRLEETSNQETPDMPVNQTSMDDDKSQASTHRGPDPVLRIASPKFGDADARADRRSDAPESAVSPPAVQVIEHAPAASPQLAGHWHDMWADISLALWSGKLVPKSREDLELAMREKMAGQGVQVANSEIKDCARLLWSKYLSSVRVTTSVGQGIDSWMESGSRFSSGLPGDSHGFAGSLAMGSGSGRGPSQISIAMGAPAGESEGGSSSGPVLQASTKQVGSVVALILDID